MHPLLNNFFVEKVFIGDNNGNLVPFDSIQEVHELSNDDKRYDDDFAARICSEPFFTFTATITNKQVCKRFQRIFQRDMNNFRRWKRRQARAKEKARRMKLKGEL